MQTRYNNLQLQPSLQLDPEKSKIKEIKHYRKTQTINQEDIPLSKNQRFNHQT